MHDRFFRLCWRDVRRCPGFTLAYYRLALCLLAARGEHASDLARRLLECAMHLEGAGNPHLRNAVDLIQRILRYQSYAEAATDRVCSCKWCLCFVMCGRVVQIGESSPEKIQWPYFAAVFIYVWTGACCW